MTDEHKTVVLLGPMRAEAAVLEPHIEDRTEQQVMGTRFVVGRIGATRVALASCGVGKVNAAMTTTIALSAFDVRGVILTGVAGATAPDIIPGDLVLGEEVCHHDFGMLNDAGFTAWQTWNPRDGEKNPLAFPAAPDLVEAGKDCAASAELEDVVAGWERRPSVRTGRIVTGDIVAATPEKRRELHEQFSAQACEMEGAGVAQVCHQHAIPWLVVRGVTDTADYTPPSFEEIARKVAPQVAGFVVALLARLEAGQTESEA